MKNHNTRSRMVDYFSMKFLLNPMITWSVASPYKPSKFYPTKYLVTYHILAPTTEGNRLEHVLEVDYSSQIVGLSIAPSIRFCTPELKHPNVYSDRSKRLLLDDELIDKSLGNLCNNLIRYFQYDPSLINPRGIASREFYDWYKANYHHLPLTPHSIWTNSWVIIMNNSQKLLQGLIDYGVAIITVAFGIYAVYEAERSSSSIEQLLKWVLILLTLAATSQLVDKLRSFRLIEKKKREIPANLEKDGSTIGENATSTLNLNFIAEDNSAMEAEVDNTMTREQLLQNLIASGFIPPPQPNTFYALNVKGGNTIPANQTLLQAGVQAGSTIIVIRTQMGGGGITISSYRDIQLIDTYLHREQIAGYHHYALYAIILYTAADKNLADFIRNNFIELHHLAGHRFIFYIIERPDSKWLPIMREELASQLGPHINDVWRILEKDQFSPVNSSTIYEIAKRMGINRAHLPCIIFFSNLNSKDLLISPLATLFDGQIEKASSQDFLKLFRGVFDKIDISVDKDEDERLKSLKQEISSLKMQGAISKIEEIALPETVGGLIGAIIKILLG
jgi:hypothetical protein